MGRELWVVVVGGFPGLCCGKGYGFSVRFAETTLFSTTFATLLCTLLGLIKLTIVVLHTHTHAQMSFYIPCVL